MTPFSWQRVSELEHKCLNLRRIIILLVAGPGILYLFFGVNISLWLLSACLALAARIFRHLNSVSLELKILAQGLEAEEQVFRWLELLPGDWNIERRIEVDNADIDLLVTTPQGIAVAIEVKSHKGNIHLSENKLVRDGNYNLDGDFISILKNRASKLALSRGLPSIACVIVFTRAKLNVTQAGIDGVFVRDLMDLIPFLHKIDIQTRKYNASRAKKYSQDLVQIVAEEELTYKPLLTRKQGLSLQKQVENLDFAINNDYSAKLHNCFRCNESIVVFTWNEHEMWSQAMPPKPIPRSIKYRYSKSLQKKYWVNTCQECGATQGDSFVYVNQISSEANSWMPLSNLVS